MKTPNDMLSAPRSRVFALMAPALMLFVSGVLNAAAPCTTPGVPTGLTLTTSANQIVLSWTAGTPAGASYTVYRAIGACPQATTLLVSGIAATTYTDSTVTGGTTYSYQVTAVDSANKCPSVKSSCASATAALYSSPRYVPVRPQDTTTVTNPVRWIFSTGAAALSPPGGSVTVASNDRFYHNTLPGTTVGAPGTASGTWPSTWKPFPMNAPVQNRPRVVNASIGGATRVSFLGSQDGRAWAVNTDTGAAIWSTVQLGTMIQAGVSGVLTQFGQSYNVLLVSTRNSSGPNYMFGINGLTGATLWQYPAAGTNLIGIVNGAAAVDASVPGSYKAYFVSRALDATNNGTVWCLNFSNVGASQCAGWPAKVALGDVDGSAVLTNGTLYVGTNTGTAYALSPSTGAVIWSTSLGDGPIKGYLWPVYNSVPNVFYVSTTNKVSRLTYTSGASAAITWSANIAGPSIPYYSNGTSTLYVGSSDGKLHQLSNLSLAAPTDTTLTIGAGTAIVGSPASDSSGQINVGTDQGMVYSLTIPY